MNKFFTTITNERGDVLPNHRAQVVDSTGAIVTIYQDKSGTRFTDASGNIINYATAGQNGRVSFYFEAEDGQVLQTLDTAGELKFSEPDFSDNFTLALGNGRTVFEVIASADTTVYVNGSTGSDSSGNGTSGNPFATIQKAVDSLSTLTGTYSAVIDVAAGTYATSSRAAASMDRPAVVYVDGLKIGKRTAQSGSTLSGGLVIKLASGAKITPNATYPRGIYVTGHVGSVGIVGGEVEAATGAESLIVAHRGAYVHVRNTLCDGNSIASLGLAAEAGGYLEAIDVSASGSTSDAYASYSSTVQMSAPAGTATVANVTTGSGGTISLAVGMTCTGTIISRGGLIDANGTVSLPITISGNYDGQGGKFTGANVRFTNTASSIVPVGESWKVDSLYSNAVINNRGGVLTLNDFQAFIAPATQSTHAHPIRNLDGGRTTFSATINSKSNSGAIRSADLLAATVTVSADSQVITMTPSGQTHHLILLSNTKGSIATGCTLSRELAGYLAGTRVGNGQIVTLFNNGTGIEIVNGTTMTGLNGGTITLGSASGQTRSMTVAYHTGIGQWFPVGFGQVVP